jgi:hypothetical protein
MSVPIKDKKISAADSSPFFTAVPPFYRTIPRRLHFGWSRTSCCCQRGISRVYPASPKPAFIKNEQKAKTKAFSLRSNGGRCLAAKIHRRFPAVFASRPFSLGGHFAAIWPLVLAAI